MHEQRILRTCQKHNVVCLNMLAGSLRVGCGNGLAKRASARGRAVVRITRPQPFDRLLHHCRWCVEIRITDTQDDDVFAPIAGSSRFVVCQPCISPSPLMRCTRGENFILERLRVRGAGLHIADK